MLLRVAPFVRLLRKVLADLFAGVDMRISAKSVSLIQEATESFMTDRLRRAQVVAIESRNRTTLSGVDLKVVAYCKEEIMPRIGTYDYTVL